MSRFAIGTDFPKTISFVCAKRNGGKAVPAFRGQVSPGGELLFARTKRNQKCAGGQARRNFKRQGRALVPSACTPGPLVLAKSAQLHFRLTAKIPFAPLLVLSPQDPLRWALAGAPVTGAQDRIMQRPISGVGVRRCSKPLFSAAALLVVVVTCRACGTRLLSLGICTRRSTVGR